MDKKLTIAEYHSYIAYKCLDDQSNIWPRMAGGWGLERTRRRFVREYFWGSECDREAEKGARKKKFKMMRVQNGWIEIFHNFPFITDKDYMEYFEDGDGKRKFQKHSLCKSAKSHIVMFNLPTDLSILLPPRWG